MTTMVVVGVTSTLLGALLWELGERAWKARWKRGLKKLVPFSRDSTLYLIYPPRHGGEEGLLPKTSSEDFMAINNMISAFLSLGWNSNRFVVRDTDRVTGEHEKQNMVIFCSPKSNELAERLQQKLLQDGVNFYHFREVSVHGFKQWVLNGGGALYVSPAVTAEHRHRQAGDEKPLHSETLEDVAVVTSIRNPWNPDTRILWIAGVRGVGTWGAAETVKKWHKQLYTVLRRTKARKTGSFSALLRITYSNSDIVKSKVSGFISIDD